MVTGIASAGDQIHDALGENGGAVHEKASPAVGEPIKSLPTLAAEVIGGGIRVRNANREDPAIDLRGIDFRIRTEPKDFGSFVYVEPTTILNEQTLTPELCRSGLQLIAPMLADAIVARGQLSFEIEQCTIPVGQMGDRERQELTDVGGIIRMTDVSVGLNNDITTKLLSLLKRFGKVADDVRLTVSRSSEVRFHVVGGRVHHQGLMFLLPIADSDFELTSSGSVGFDETLDLELELGFPSSLLGDGPLARFLESDPVVVQVSGSLDEPHLQFSAGDWNRRLAALLNRRVSSAPEEPVQQDEDGEVTGEIIQESANVVLDMVGGLLDRKTEGGSTIRESLRERRRARRSPDDPESTRPRMFRRRQTQE